MLLEMANSGFEIGLHFDPTVYDNIPSNEFKIKVDMEANILEFITNQKVKSISLHNPSIRLLQNINHSIVFVGIGDIFANHFSNPSNLSNLFSISAIAF